MRPKATPCSELPTPTQGDFDRFVKRIEITDDCWLMQGSSTLGGYVQFQYQGTRIMSHRFAYIFFVGEISASLEIDHLCRVSNCVNVDHLEPVTAKENLRRDPKNITTINAAKTECHKGHNLKKARIMPDGERRCLICVSNRNQLNYRKNRDSVLKRIGERKRRLAAEKKAVEAAGQVWGGPKY